MTNDLYEAKWFDEHGNVLALARHMVSEGLIETPEELICFFEKPWKWGNEWDSAQRSGAL
tara:strand:- start:276 stop:455 length:180 start_codon:yes stop_codon:yes gene_type:complete